MWYIILVSGLAVIYSTLGMDTFRAAVYEHAVIYPSDRSRIVTRREALQVMERNLVIYRQQAIKAASMGAKITVFPEYGLYGLDWTRQTLQPYLEQIPDPNSTTWNPCDQPTHCANTEVQRNLSCIAKNASIYIAANLPGYVPCEKSDPDCPRDMRYQYSATVVYNTKGDFVARYFKYNMSPDELYFDKPKTPDHTVFNTSFGRFGIFITQDIMYREPTLSLVKQNITNFIFPVAWKNELPLFSAIEFHSSFAEGMLVNLLAANLHIPSRGFFGTGLYWPTGTSINASYTNDKSEGGGKLVVETMKPFRIPPASRKRMDAKLAKWSEAKLEKRITSDKRKQKDTVVTKSRAISKNFGEADNLVKEEQTYDININGDTYTAVILRDNYGSVNACQGHLCCSADYETDGPNGDLFAFAAFDGMHTSGGQYYLQACAFVKCANSSVESCGQPTTTSQWYTSKMSFVANFSTNYVFPEVLTDQNGSPGLVTSIWYYQGSIIIDAGLNGQTLTISMLARDYSKDP